MSRSTRHSMNPAKVWRIATHEFRSTALTKGFIIGVVIVPLILVVIIPLLGFLIEGAKPPVVRGRLAIIDGTGVVAPLVTERLGEEAMRQQRGEQARQAAEAIEAAAGELTDAAPVNIAGAAEAAASASPVPIIRVESLPASADPEPLKEEVRAAMRDDLPLDDPAAQRLLGVVTVDADAVTPDPQEGFGKFELFVDRKIDQRTVSDIEDAIFESIRDARFTAAGYDRAELARLQNVGADVQEITEEGTRDSNKALTMLMPGAFMLLILMSVFTGGQYLLTTTIEEKSSRVVEVLLSSVSPMELMSGKIIGQMLVGLAMMTIYSGLGLVALATLANRLDAVQPIQVVYMLIFFVLAYFMFASMMAAAGSAVNELREAQSLMTPIMLVAMVPYFLFLPVSLAPSAPYSVALSFIPPINPFIMMIRVASTDPPPIWQVILSIAIGAAGCVFCVWMTAKIFRVGLLMFGKPPNLMTLVKWIRMA